MNCILKSRQDKLLQLGQRDQPIIVVIGDKLETVTGHLILLDGSRFTMTSILQAIDVLFKCFQSSMAFYPTECKQVWYLLQKALYDIHTSWDETIPTVETLLADLK